ncbi:proline-rich receptor-like protein kinase PERK8, partial [Diaphorina citri]|uniref:Proline-rich receptor-like protein kinase PERK8 n=1 Tax=Diaphorina citri TaxID=121845 RepID=A0A1S3DRR9_DIACI
DAFFGRELLDSTKDSAQDLDSSASEESEDTQVRFKITDEKTITLSEAPPPSACPPSSTPPASQLMPQQAPSSSTGPPEVCDDDEDSLDELSSDLASPPERPPRSPNTKASNTSPPPPTVDTQTPSLARTPLVQKVAFPTTIPSHPSTIQYIPIVPNTTATPTSNTASLRATLHFVHNETATTSGGDETSPSGNQRTIQYQLIANPSQ